MQVYYFIPVGFRGDLKQVVQAFNLKRKPGSEQAWAHGGEFRVSAKS